MTDESSVPRVPAVVRQLRARLRGRRGARSRLFRTDSDTTRTHTGYFCRTCGAGFEGRHGTCPQCGGGMIERGVETGGEADSR
ncbi:hypothetical protein ACFO0N_12840 [Halobium salinum]|uniref:Uncharacterized protein n=1 Tax=Halobium salinum TaxID=1364940 RepID=A0ABD5PDP9_9EURY|nr:hypothetical protein [Halobium salinum]